MLDAAEPGNVTVNADIVRRIREYEVRAFVCHQKSIGRGFSRVTAHKHVLTQQPYVTRAADRRAVRAFGREIFGLLAFLADTFDDEVRFGGLKTGQINIEA